MSKLYKFTSILLAAFLILGLCPVYAAGEDAAGIDPIEIVRELGIIKGTGNGVDPAYLASNPIRLNTAILFLRLAGLEEEAYAYEGVNGFTDTDALSARYRNMLSYLKDHPELGFTGLPDGSFRPYEVMTAREFTKVMLNVLGYEMITDGNPGGDFTWDGVFEFAASLGLDKAGDAADFCMSDLISVLAQALAMPEKGGDTATLADRLADEGIIDTKTASSYDLLKEYASEFDPIEVIEDLGIIKGTGNGLDTAYLASNPIRMNVAILFLRLAGLEEEACAYEGVNGFTDMDTLSQRYRSLLCYLKDHPELGFTGLPDGSFRPYEVMTAREFTKVMLTVLGYEMITDSNPGGDFTWDGVFEFAASLGLGKAKDIKNFRMENVITILAQALAVPTKGGDSVTLAGKLAEEGIIDADIADSYKLLPEKEAEPSEEPLPSEAPSSAPSSPAPSEQPSPAPSEQPPEEEEDPQLENAIFVNGATGDDNNDGSWASPFKTVQKAASVAEAGETVYIREGIYRETVTPANSGTAEAPIKYTAYNGEDVVITALDPVNAEWEQHEGNIYKTTENLTLGSQNAIFADLDMQMLARWPNVPDHLTRSSVQADNKDERTTATTLYDAEMMDNDWTGGKVWVYANWISWTSDIKGYENKVLTVDNNAPDFWTELDYHEIGVNKLYYYIYNHLDALDAPGEWYYDEDEKTLYFYAPDGGVPENVDKKTRGVVLVLDNRSYIELEGIRVIGAGIKGDNMNHVTFDKMKIQDYGYDSDCTGKYGSQKNIGIILSGDSITFSNSEIFNCSGYGLSIKGNDAVIFNNYIHDIGYAGAFTEGFSINGSNAHVAYNTISRTGAGGVGGNMTYAALIEYNDFSFCGMVSFDNGTMHWAKNDYQNTEIRYNDFHDGQDGASYIYLDNACTNMIIHHNNVFNTFDGGLAAGMNHPGNHVKFYNNVLEGGFESLWGHVFKDETYQSEIYDNITTKEVLITGTGKAYNNTIVPADEIADYRLEFPNGPAGHNFENPPVKPEMVFSDHPRRNLVKDSGFEGMIDHFDVPNDLSKWTKTGTMTAVGQQAVGESINQEEGYTRSGENSVRLKEGLNGIEQTIDGLIPDSWYEFSVWVKATGTAAAETGVKDFGGETQSVTVAPTGAAWKQIIIQFKTGQDGTSATIFLNKTTTGTQPVYGDDFGLVYIGDELPPPPDPLPGENLIRDPGFEDQDGSWALNLATLSQTDPFRGEYNVCIQTGGSGSQTVEYELIPGEAYMLSAIGKLASSGGAFTVSVRAKDENGNYINNDPEAVLTFNTDVNTSHSAQFTMPQGAVTAEVSFANNSGRDGYLDQLNLHQIVNLIPNPGFEDYDRLLGYLATTNTSVKTDSSNAHSGDRYMAMENGSVAGAYAYTHTYVTVAVNENTTYEFSAWGKRGPGLIEGAFISVECQYNKSDVSIELDTPIILTFTTQSYAQKTTTFTTPPGTTVLKLVFWCPAGTEAQMFIDDMSIVEKPGTVVDPGTPPEIVIPEEPEGPVNLITGGDCESLSAWGWFDNSERELTDDGHEGKAVVVKKNGAYLIIPDGFEEGKRYRFSAWGKRGEGEPAQVHVVVLAQDPSLPDLNLSVFTLANWTNTGDYEQHSIEFTVPPGTEQLRFQIWVDNCDLYLDDIVLIEVEDDGPEGPVNLIPGGDCETTQTWSSPSFIQFTDDAYSGDRAILIPVVSSESYSAHTIYKAEFEPGEYEFSVYYKRGAGTIDSEDLNIAILVKDNVNPQIAYALTDLTNQTEDYVRKSITFTVSEDIQELVLLFYITDTDVALYLDEISLVKTADEDPGSGTGGSSPEPEDPDNIFPYGNCDTDTSAIWGWYGTEGDTPKFDMTEDAVSGTAFYIPSGRGTAFSIESGFTVGETYTFSAWGKRGEGGTGLYFQITPQDASGTATGGPYTLNWTTDSYVKDSVSFTIPEGTTKLRFQIHVDGAALYVDEIELVPVNLITGGDCDTDTSALWGWYSQDPKFTMVDDAVRGTAYQITSGNGTSYTIADGFEAGETYTFSAWGKRGAGALGDLYFQIILRDASDVQIGDVYSLNWTTESYEKKSVSIAIPEGTAKIFFQIHVGGADLFIDAIKLTKDL